MFALETRVAGLLRSDPAWELEGQRRRRAGGLWRLCSVGMAKNAFLSRVGFVGGWHGLLPVDLRSSFRRSDFCRAFVLRLSAAWFAF